MTLSAGVHVLQDRIKTADTHLVSALLASRVVDIHTYVEKAHRALRGACESCGHWPQDGHAADCPELKVDTGVPCSECGEMHVIHMNHQWRDSRGWTKDMIEASRKSKR